MGNFEISVVIPSYNGENFIAEAINCVLMQSYPALEIIVVDDGSTDRTAEIVASLPGNIRFISQEHTGFPAAGRNRGIRAAKGEFIALLDQDDLWPENTLQIHIENMMANPTAEMDVGKTQKMALANFSDSELIFEPFDLPENLFLLAGTLIRKTTFGKIGFFNESMNFYGSDFDWIIRFREANLLVNIHERITLFYRMHHANHSKDYSMWKRAIIEVFKLSMDRRRQKGGKSLIPLPGFNTIPK